MDTFATLQNEFADLKKMEKEFAENNDDDDDDDDDLKKMGDDPDDDNEDISDEEGDDDPLINDKTDQEIEAMKRKVQEMEEEAAKIEALQYSVERSMKSPALGGISEALQHNGMAGMMSGMGGSMGPVADSKSIYVGNVDYSTTAEELMEFFQSCGTVNRITIPCNKWSGHPKGYAYIEFKDQDSVVNTMILNDTTFKGRPLKISPKRTNIFGYNRRYTRRRRRRRRVSNYGWSQAGFYAPRRRRRRRYIPSYYDYY